MWPFESKWRGGMYPDVSISAADCREDLVCLEGYCKRLKHPHSSSPSYSSRSTSSCRPSSRNVARHPQCLYLLPSLWWRLWRGSNQLFISHQLQFQFPSPGKITRGRKVRNSNTHELSARTPSSPQTLYSDATSCGIPDHST